MHNDLDYHAGQLVKALIEHPTFKSLIRATIDEALARAPMPVPVEIGEPVLGAYLSLKQLAEYLQVGRTTIWKWQRDGKFPKSIKFGSSTRWARVDVERWIEISRTGRQWPEGE